MESLLKKDSNLSIEHCSFKGFALLDNGVIKYIRNSLDLIGFADYVCIGIKN
jgi:hypothetical protein